MSEILDDISTATKEINNLELKSKQEQVSAIKDLIKEKADILVRLERIIELAENSLKELSSQYNEKLEEIRKIWAPFLTGVDKSELDLGEYKLTMSNRLNIKAEDQEAINSWFIENGYEEVMRYQIHNQTFKKIAKELKEHPEHPVEIPGAVYSSFQLIEVKKNKRV